VLTIRISDYIKRGMTEAPWYENVVIPALLRHARYTYGSAMRRALDAAGYDDLPANGLYVIGGLAKDDGGIPLGELIRQLRISKQAAGQLVDTLVMRGYLERATDPQDRRKLTLNLTERGRAAAEAQNGAREVIDSELVSRAGADNVRIAKGVLGILCAMGMEGSEDQQAAAA
jgi:DNA-binding MarR family transcriptional regulator